MVKTSSKLLIVFILAVGVTLSACATLPADYYLRASDEAAGTVQLAYVERAFEDRFHNPRTAKIYAGNRCREWGYSDAVLETRYRVDNYSDEYVFNFKCVP